MLKTCTILITAFILAACATVLDGRWQQLGFDSNEKDTEIFINGEFVCKTPCMTNVRRRNEQLMITAKKDGFEDRTLFLNSNINRTSVFNVLSLWSSTFGFSTDMSSKTIWQYQPNAFYVAMLKEPKTAKEKTLYAQQNKIRDFVLVNYDQLQSDVYQSNGNGEYLKTLSAMTGISVLQITSVLQNSYAAPDAAENIVGRYIVLTR